MIDFNITKDEEYEKFEGEEIEIGLGVHISQKKYVAKIKIVRDRLPRLSERLHQMQWP